MRLFACRLLPLGVLSLLSFPSHAFNLSDAWQAALDYDSSYSAAQNQHRAAQEKAVQARATLLPQVNASAQYQRQYQYEPLSQSSRNHGWNIQASQALFDAAKYATYQQGQVSIRIADEQLQLAVQKLLLDVSQAYFDVLLAEDTLKATQASKTAYAKQLDQAKTMFDVGAATVVDTYEARAGFESAQVKEMAAQTQLSVAKQKLENLTGLDPAHIQKVDGDKLQRLLPSRDLAYWLETAQTHSNSLTVQNLAIESARQSRLAAQAARLPTLQLQGGYQDGVTHTDNSGHVSSRGGSVSLNLSVPLFAGGGINSQIREAKAKELQARDEWLAAQRTLNVTVKQNYLNMLSGHKQVLALMQLVKTSQAKLDSTRLGQQVGVRSNLDVILAQQSLLEAQQQLAKARYDYLQAHLALAQSAGVLQNSEQMDRINQVIVTAPIRP